jgi:hypothetical protein
MDEEEGGNQVSPAAKLCGFLILLAVIFAGAYVAGARLGPVSAGRSQTSSPGMMNMGGTGTSYGRTGSGR